MHTERRISASLLNLAAILSTFWLLWIPSQASAQQFEEGLQYYRQAEYTQAALVFQKLDSPKARLFEAKSYFGLGQYVKANNLLFRSSNSLPEELLLEAEYLSALSYFQLKQFDKALTRLHMLSKTTAASSIARDSKTFYNGILDYLTLNQRKEAYQGVSSPEIKYDLIHAALGRVDFPTAKLLFTEFKKMELPDSLEQKMVRLENIITDSVRYVNNFSSNKGLKAPSGITYNIGAALPRYEAGNRAFEVTQGLYFGYLLAADRFNRRNGDKKAYIRYKNTGADTDSSEYLMTDFAWNYQIDAILGPLFSGAAANMSEWAELYEIPMIAPLANADSINLYNPYFFQANPTLAVHGRNMAQHAVRKLGMDTLAVLAESTTRGAESAYAFRDEAERLGAKVVYFFVEDLESQGYSVTDYTKYFTGNAALIDSLNYPKVDAVYAPFTGQAASTLINLLLVDLEAMNSTVTVLGSQDWEGVDIPKEQLKSRSIYFSESYLDARQEPSAENFHQQYRERFGMDPNRFSMIGFDVASFLLNTLEKVENPAMLKNALPQQPRYEGIIGTFYFDGKHINQAVGIYRLTAEEGAIPAGMEK